MNQLQENHLKVVMAPSPVSIIRASAKARCGCKESMRWLEDQHRNGNSAATKALGDLNRRLPQTLAA